MADLVFCSKCRFCVKVGEEYECRAPQNFGVCRTWFNEVEEPFNEPCWINAGNDCKWFEPGWEVGREGASVAVTEVRCGDV